MILAHVVYVTRFRHPTEFDFAKESIPWQVYLCDAENPKLTVIFLPNPNSVLQLGLVELRSDLPLPWDIYSVAYCVNPFYLLAEGFQHVKNNSYIERSALDLLHQMNLSQKDIHTYDENSRAFMAQFFSNVELIPQPFRWMPNYNPFLPFALNKESDCPLQLSESELEHLARTEDLGSELLKDINVMEWSDNWEEDMLKCDTTLPGPIKTTDPLNTKDLKWDFKFQKSSEEDSNYSDLSLQTSSSDSQLTSRSYHSHTTNESDSLFSCNLEEDSSYSSNMSKEIFYTSETSDLSESNQSNISDNKEPSNVKEYDSNELSEPNVDQEFDDSIIGERDSIGADSEINLNHNKISELNDVETSAGDSSFKKQFSRWRNGQTLKQEQKFPRYNLRVRKLAKIQK